MKCPICQNMTESFTDSAKDILYHECSVCQYIYKSPDIHPDLEQQKIRYDLHENDPEDEGYRAYFQRFLDFVLPVVGNSGGRALDFGSGESDLLAQMLSKHRYRTLSYDPIYRPDDYKKFRYNLIVSTEVFEHLSTPLHTLKALASLLEEGGYIALQTQFRPHDREGFLDWYYRLDPTHIGFFAAKTLRYAAQKAGLRYIDDDGKNKIIFQNH